VNQNNSPLTNLISLAIVGDQDVCLWTQSCFLP